MARATATPNTRTWRLYLPFCVFSSALAAAYWDARQGGNSLSALLWLIGIAGACALSMRRRAPIQTMLGLAAMTSVLPLDPVAMLIAYASLTVRRLDRVWGGLTVLAVAVTGWSTWRDGQGTTAKESFWQTILESPGAPGSTHPPVSWPTALLIGAILVGVAAAIGLVVRERARSRAAAAVVESQTEVVDTLTDQVARQAERERIAREVHDALGHRLSLLSLHAGALELAAQNVDPKTAETAALLRANASQSMADLRHLINELHTPGDPDIAHAVPTLRDVAALIDESISAGLVLVSTVTFDAVDRLDQQTSRSAYRLVQELLTNARKHAPGAGVRLLVTATPAVGVQIEAANQLPSGASTELRAGHGLTGAATRVEQLGGQWRCWVDEQRTVRAAAHLPWLWDEPEVAS